MPKSRILILMSGLTLATALSLSGCDGDGPAAPDDPDDPGDATQTYRLVLPDSFHVCRDGTYSMTAELLPSPQSADTTVLYGWSCYGRAGRLYLNYFTDHHIWTSTEPDAHFLAEYYAEYDTIYCTASLRVGDGEPAAVAWDTVYARVGQPGIVHPGELSGEIVWNQDNTHYTWSVYVICPLEPGYMRHQFHGEGFDDPAYWGTEIEFIGPPYLYGSLVYEDEVWIFLTGGSAGYDPDHPEAPASALDLAMSRFDGGVWTMSPLCDDPY